MIGGLILCIGDSLTFGARDEYGLHYPELLSRKLSEKYDQWWSAVNHGISGETTAQILRRCLGHVRAYPEAADVFLWAGFNDAKTNVATPPDLYKENMESMIRSILFRDRACYVFQLPLMEGFGAPDFMDNDLIRAYNDKLLALNIKYMKHRFTLLSAPLKAEHRNDGVHLTHAGNHVVAETAMRGIETMRGNWEGML